MFVNDNFSCIYRIALFMCNCYALAYCVDQEQQLRNVYDYFNRTLIARYRRRLMLLTAETYPLPGSAYCAHEYLKLWYVCDPHLWLTHTDALKLNKSLNPKKFTHCSAQSSSSKSTTFYSLGVALASGIQASNVDSCPSGDVLTRRINSLDSDEVIKRHLRDIARKLRRRWSSQHNGCAKDILILFVKSLVLCINGHLTTVHADSPMMAVSFGQRVLSSLSEESAMGLEKSTVQVDSDFELPPGSALHGILRIFSILNAALPSTTSNSSNVDYSLSSTSNAPSNTNILFPKHTIPVWALIAFVVSMSLTLICTIIGHWVNTSGSRSKFYAPDRFPFARSHHSNRRWRAGFAGGMMELHNNTGPTTGQRSFSTVGLRPMSGGGRAKSKMFGAISMNNKRNNFNPQYNYQRV